MLCVIVRLPIGYVDDIMQGQTRRNYECQPDMEFIKNHWLEGEKVCVRALKPRSSMYKGIVLQLANAQFRYGLIERTGCDISPIKSKDGRALGRILQPLVANRNYKPLKTSSDLVAQMVYDRGQFDRIIELQGKKIATHMDNLRQAQTTTSSI